MAGRIRILARGLAAPEPAEDNPSPEPGSWYVESDFENDTYAISGVSKSLEDVWVQNTAWGDFDTSNVDSGVGLRDINGDDTAHPALSAEALAVGDGLGNGFSAICEVTVYENASLSWAIFEDPDYTGWFYIESNNLATQLADGNTAGGYTTNLLAEGDHTLRMTVTSSKIAWSVDGDAVVATPPNGTPMTPEATDAVGISTGASSTATVIKNIKFREPVDDTTLLSLV